MINRSRLTLFASLGAVAVMLGVSFASKPLYDAFCRVTGYGGTTQVADARPSQVLEREVSIRLDSNVGLHTGLKFKPVDRSYPLKLGETGLAFFEVSNPTDEPIRAIASYNVAPHKVGPYFNKLECFCFDERVFPPGHSEKLPVIFFIDPTLDEERQLKDVTDITLSYTFYDVEKENNYRSAWLEGGTSAH